MLDRDMYPSLNQIQNEVTGLTHDRHAEPSIGAVGFLASLMELLIDCLSFEGTTQRDSRRAARLVLLSELVDRSLKTSKGLTRNEVYILTRFFRRAAIESHMKVEIFQWLFEHEDKIIVAAAESRAWRLGKAA